VGRGKIQGAGFGSGIRDAVFLCPRLTAEAAALREVLTLISLTLFSSDCFVSFVDLGIETFAQLRWLVGLHRWRQLIRQQRKSLPIASGLPAELLDVCSVFTMIFLGVLAQGAEICCLLLLQWRRG
jgi:hypothetical protein